ncbi:hypothetical protein B0H19DRAFT_221943 [Mycena capillaripes]|nr:hypothetical protein B0H19DRAFT_221943 [Mycena capillaripes]
MRAAFGGWEPRSGLVVVVCGSCCTTYRVQKLVSTTLIWPLLYREPLDAWVALTSSGKVVFLGDAGQFQIHLHSPLPPLKLLTKGFIVKPSRAQGCAAMAVEDVYFSRIYQATASCWMDIKVSDIIARHRLIGTTTTPFFHLEDGLKQEERDRRNGAGAGAKPKDSAEELDGKCEYVAMSG